MKEEFLHFLWKHQYVQSGDLRTTNGASIQVVHPGKLNQDAGPDFFNAAIKIDEQLWHGNVEIHYKASDWYHHKHHEDAAYNNVILHVVAIADDTVQLPSGEPLPALVLNPDEVLYNNYESLMQAHSVPACSDKIDSLESIYVFAVLDALLIERLDQKMSNIARVLQQNKNDWTATFYQMLATNMGFKVNALPFEMLIRSLPVKVLLKHAHSIFELEALLYGQSGLLNEKLLGDEYFLKLRDEYRFLMKKYALNGMEGHLWKFMRMRPANFPSLRISQFAAIINKSDSILSLLIDMENERDIMQLFKVKASSYWDNHYTFNQVSKYKVKHLGVSSQRNLLINMVVPFLYLYGIRHNKAFLKTKALRILEQLPPEQNSIIKMWSKLGIKSMNAGDSQALIQLKNVYCEKKKCLSCQIGNKVICK